MNRYPLWKYIIVAVALVLGFVYTLPNFFGESPAVQVSSAKATIKVDQKSLARVEEALKAATIAQDDDERLAARERIERHMDGALERILHGHET